MTKHVPLDLATCHRLHVVGVGGPGMSAIALVLAEMGHEVSGSDLSERPVLDRLRSAGVDVSIGHDRQLVHGVDAVTMSTAIPARNIELVEAEAIGVPVLRRAGMLASICAMADSLGVAGTHGKTTTTSMLMQILAEAGYRPSFVIGGDVADMGTGAQWTGGQWLVVEADESDKTHLELPLFGTILTNVEVDHLDHYGTAEAIDDAFVDYLAGIAGPKVVCVDDAGCRRIIDRLPASTEIITYGTDAAAAWRIDDVVAQPGAMTFTVRHGADEPVAVRVPLRGVHNVANATAALVMAASIGIPPAISVQALRRFGGVARRFDVRGQHNGATLVDDYAHLPTEIAAVLAAARASGGEWDRVVAVFQPNRYNRMAELWPAYVDAFVDADVTVLTEIYPSGTTPIPGVSAELIVEAIRRAHPAADVRWVEHRADLVDAVADLIGPGDVCISMGCGDIAALPEEILAAADERGSND